MNRNQFVDKLRWRLFFLPRKEVDAVVSYYSEMIDDYMDDGLTEEQAVNKLGSINDIVRNMRSDRTVSREYINKEYVKNPEGIEKILLVDCNNNIEIKKSNDDMVHLHYYENEEDYYEISESATEVTIVNITKEKRSFYGMIAKPILNRKVILEIPENYQNDLEVESNNASIANQGIISLREIKIVTSNGSLNLSNITCVNEIIGITSNGTISAKNLTGYSIKLVTSNGAIRVEQLSSHNVLSLDTSNGSLIANDIYTTQKMKLSTSNGRLVATINDDIKNYNITSHTSNGTNNLPSHLKLGDKVLDVKNGNGSINVTFTNNTPNE